MERATARTGNVTLLVTPLKMELQPMLTAFADMGLAIETKQDQGFWFWEIPQKNIVCCLGGLGKPQFALQSQYAIDYLKNVNRLLCVGAAGGLHPERKAFDIICATEVIEHDHKERFNPTGSLLSHKVDKELLSKIKSKSPQFPHLYFGPVASGDEDINCRERASDLFAETQALAVAWEGAGGARAAHFNGIPYNEIRGISDHACSNAPQDFTKNLPSVMKSLAELVAEIF